MTKDKIQFLIDTDQLDEVQTHLRETLPASARCAYYVLPLREQTLLVAAHGAEELASALEGHPCASDYRVPHDEDQLDPLEWGERFDAYDRYRSQVNKLTLHEVHPPTDTPSLSLVKSTDEMSIDRRFDVTGAPLMSSWAYGPFEPAEANIWVHVSKGSSPRAGYRAHVWPVRAHGDQRSQEFMGDRDKHGHLSGTAPEWLTAMVHEMFADLEELQSNLVHRDPAEAPDPTPEQIEAAAEAMWDSAKPVRAGVRKRWSQAVNDQEYKQPVQSTLREARVALEAASKIRGER